jgi:hypothetical protein
MWTMAKRHKGTRAAFQTVDIRKTAITSLLDVPAGSVIDLAFLGGFGDRERRGGFFMPESLYVREEMHSVWKEIEANDADDEVFNQVLIGPPGVGKSVLLFLYALHRAQGGKKVMYWRKARVDKSGISLFCMEPASLADAEESVRIQFTTAIPWEENISDIYIKYMQKTFPDLYQDVEDEIEAKALTVELLRNEVLMFVDGPRYEDKKDTKDGSIHFLCTSGGHPGPKNDERNSLKVVVMTGWKKGSLCDALKCYAKEDVVEKIWEMEIWGEEQDGKEDKVRPTIMDVGNDNDVASYEEKLEGVVDLVYYYTGGRIRDALKIVKGVDNIEGFAKYLCDFVKDVPPEGIDLAVRKKYGTKAATSFDTLRTYFKEKGKGGYIQIIDSAYVLSLLDDLEIETKYLDAYKEAIALDEKTVAGYQFEKLMHKVFVRISKECGDESPFNGYIKSMGTAIEGVRQIEKNKYWMPSVPNFPGIDAALVCNDGTTFGAQYFAGKRHGFKVKAFKSQFLNQIPQEVGADLDSVWIVFVVPKDQNGEPDDLDALESRVVTIDTESMDTMTRDAMKVFQKWETEG